MPKIALDLKNPHIFEGFLTEAYRGFMLYAREYTNWELFFRQCYYAPHYEGTPYKNLHKLGVDAIVFDYATEAQAAEIARTQLPAVNIGGRSFNGKFSCVHQDNLEIGRTGARHFLERGLKHFAYIGWGRIPASRLRHQGFSETLKNSGHECHLLEAELTNSPFYSYFIPDALETADNPQAVTEWLEKLPKPVGILCYQDAVAYILKRACIRQNIKIPDQVAILGVQEFPFPDDFNTFAISSIDHNARQCGFAAAKLLQKQLNGSTKKEQVYIPPKEVITRESTQKYCFEDPRLQQALTYINNHFPEPITSDEIARECNISRATLNRLFSKHLGYTVADSVRRHRLQRARTLLKDSSLSIKEISYLTGFSNAPHFTNKFRCVYGLSPREWRKA